MYLRANGSRTSARRRHSIRRWLKWQRHSDQWSVIKPRSQNIMTSSPAFSLRLATEDDIPALHALIEASVRGLQANDYTQAQMEGALGTVLGLDSQLIADRTYYIAEVSESAETPAGLARCGGAAGRDTPFGCGPRRARRAYLPRARATARHR